MYFTSAVTELIMIKSTRKNNILFIENESKMNIIVGSFIFTFILAEIH